VTLRCPSCGHANPTDQRFCGNCGAALPRPEAETATSPPPRPGTVPARPSDGGQFLPGQVVADRYRLISDSLLGEQQ